MLRMRLGLVLFPICFGAAGSVLMPEWAVVRLMSGETATGQKNRLEGFPAFNRMKEGGGYFASSSVFSSSPVETLVATKVITWCF